MENNYVDSKARFGRSCRVGHYTVIREGVSIGDEVIIGNSVTIYPDTVIGSRVVIGDNAVIGKQPQPAKTSTVRYDQLLPPLCINDGVIIGSSVVLYAGSSIGKDVMIGDLASIREECAIGDGTVVGRGVAIENKVSVGSLCKLQTNAYITASTTLADQVFIAPCVITTNDNKMGRTRARLALKKGAHIEKGARVGAGALLLPGVKIAAETFVAAGSLVSRDTSYGQLVMGRPAKTIRTVAEEELLRKRPF